MGRSLGAVVILTAVIVLPACGGQREPQPPLPISGSPRSAALGGNPLTQVQKGMTKGQVRNLAGSPQAEKSYELSILSLAALSGEPRSRTDWYYRGRGRVVFGESVERGGTATVLRVDIEKPAPGLTK